MACAGCRTQDINIDIDQYYTGLDTVSQNTVCVVSKVTNNSYNTVTVSSSTVNGNECM